MYDAVVLPGGLEGANNLAAVSQSFGFINKQIIRVPFIASKKDPFIKALLPL